MHILWKQYKEKYYISNTGLIKNINTGKILKLRPSHKGYLKTNISINGNIEMIFIHRIVAELFIPNPNNLPQVNHKDGNKLNNTVENLEWCTAKDNVQHAINNNLICHKSGIEVYNSKLTEEIVKYLRLNFSYGKNLKRGMITSLAKQFNVSRKTIRDVIYYKTYRSLV